MSPRVARSTVFKIKVGGKKTFVKQTRWFLSVSVLVGGSIAVPAASPGAPPPTRGTELSAQERTRLVTAYNRWAAGLRTLRAGGKARVGAVGEKTRVFDFSMALARPGSARVQGRWGSLATLFDLSGDLSGWTLYLPRDQAVVFARDESSSAGLLLPPLEIISVLLPAGIPPRDLETQGAADVEGDQVRLVVPPGRGGAGSTAHRVIWVDREKGTPTRLEIRRNSQLEQPILVANYEEYEGKGAEAFAVEVMVEMPESEQWARFVFETVRINTDVASSAFDINIPEGTRRLDPEDLTPDFLPVAEDQ